MVYSTIVMSDPLIASPTDAPPAPAESGGVQAGEPPLLGSDEPASHEGFNPDGTAPLLLVCDHATRFLPRRLGTLGLSEAELARHIAWDIGIAEVTRGLARRLDAPAVLSRFSRLAIDPNRALNDPTLIPQISDGVVIPGNQSLSPGDVQARIESFHRPYHQAIERRLDALVARGPAPAVVSMHSFTPVIKGVERPWQIGILWDADPRLAQPLMARLRAQGVPVGDNQPYTARDGHGYTLFEHAAPRGLAHVLIEIRQDLVDTHHGAAAWTDRLADSLRVVLENARVFRGARSV
ncbi:MAG: N-formylglutamate amidohydrolase [Alphaproteobacteria bacterium]